MSAEGKKKRGISGQANAKEQPFRLGGKPCDYSLGRRLGAAAHPRWAGSKLVSAFTLGAALSNKYPFDLSPILAERVNAALARCTKA